MREPLGNWSAMHFASIEQAAKLQLNALAEISKEWATGVDLPDLEQENLRLEDFVDLLDGAKDDPEARMQLDDTIRASLVAALNEVFQPPQPPPQAGDPGLVDPARLGEGVDY